MHHMPPRVGESCLCKAHSEAGMTDRAAAIREELIEQATQALKDRAIARPRTVVDYSDVSATVIDALDIPSKLAAAVELRKCVAPDELNYNVLATFDAAMEKKP